MLKKIKLVLSLIDSRARISLVFFSGARVLISGIDTIGVALVGFLLTKSADQIILASSDSNVGIFGLLSFLNEFSLLEIAILALLIFITKSILSVIFTRSMATVLAEAEASLASKTFDRLLRGGYKNFSNVSSTDLIFSLNSSATNAISSLLAIAVSIFSELTLLITISVLFILVDAKIAMGIIIYFLLIGYFIYKIIGPKMQSLGEKFSDSALRSSASLNDSVNAYRELHTLRKETEFSNKFSKGRIGFAKSTAFANFYGGLPRYIVETALILGTVGLASYVFTSNSPATAAGILGIFLTGSFRIMASMLPLQTSINSLRQVLAQSERFLDLVEKTKSTQEGPNSIENRLSGDTESVSIIFENVSYSYPNTELAAVKNISFNISAGEYIALIGPSGSGKSTIADLIIKLIEPTSGKILYSDVDLNTTRIGYVPQSPGVISGSILENITLNVDSGEFNQLDLDRALKFSHLTELIQSLEDGVNTNLGAQADALSGGQLQRIGLARALYTNPDLLVLDEATSALDAETESAITESLNSLKGYCTIVVIAHRLSTVQNADRVYVVNEGQIVASGKFSELAKTNELVARYVELSKLNVD